MDGVLAALRRRRTTMLLVSLAYFAALLALGVLFFLRGVGGAAAWVLAALCVAGYLLLARPMRGRYIAAVREAVIRYAVCGGIEDLSYAPKGGISISCVQDAGLFSGLRPGAFMSREYVAGRSGPIRVEAADVTFSIAEEGRNAMFSGLLMNLARRVAAPGGGPGGRYRRPEAPRTPAGAGGGPGGADSRQPVPSLRRRGADGAAAGAVSGRSHQSPAQRR